MQTRTAHGAPPYLRRWKLAPLVVAVCATMALAGPSAASPAKAPAAISYRIIPLGVSGGGNADINAKGQVAFTDFVGDVPTANFYDGSGVRNLGTLGGVGAVINAVNDLGQVVGSAATAPPGPFHAFRWSKQTGLVDLSRPGVGNSIATDINNRGQVAGIAVFPESAPNGRAFRWSPRTGMVDLGSLNNYSGAFAINEAGTAVGYTEGPLDPGFLTLAAGWPAAGGLIPLNNFASVASVANDINNAGQIVGSAAFDAGLNDQAFIWTPAGGLRNLGAPGPFLSFAERINEKGLVIGDNFSSPGDRNGFIWSRENGVLLIGTPFVDSSDAADVNNLGQVVGSINGRAFVWTRAGGFVDLNTRIPGAPADFGLFTALAISDNGSIVATGNTGGLFLLVPQSAYHQAPVTGPVKFTGSARVNALLSFSAGFKDVDVRDTHKAVWSWGDGSKTVGTVSEKYGTGNVSAQYAYRAPGIYTVRLTVTDSSGRSSTVQRTVVVCGTQGAISGEGAFAAPAAAGKAGARQVSVGSFAFLSEGASARKSAVQVNVAGLALRSSQVEAVTLDGGRVQYSGRGTVNGAGNYRFTLTAFSGAKTGGKDRIHVRISHTEPGSKAEVVDFDNGVGAGAKAAAKGAAAAGAEGSVVIGEGKIELGAN